MVSIEDDWCDQAHIGTDSYRDINIVMLTDECVHKERVSFRNSKTGQGTCFDNEIVYRKLLWLFTFGRLLFEKCIKF